MTIPINVSMPRGWLVVRSRRRLLVGLAVLLVMVGIVVALVNPFGGGAASSGTRSSTGVASSVARVTRQSLSSQTAVGAMLGYGDASTISVPAGTAPADVVQAQQAVTSAQAALQTANASLASDTQTLAQLQASLAAQRGKEATDCAGDAAAQAAVSGAGASTSPRAVRSPASSAAACASDAQSVASAQQTLPGAAAKVAGDRLAAASAERALASATTALTAAETAETIYGSSATYTALPAVGQIVRRNESLYEISGQPVVLLYGSVAAWRAFRTGMPPGKDVAELNANLEALGYGRGLTGDAFTEATASAIDAFQAAHGLAGTGALLLGSVVFKLGPVRVTSVTASTSSAGTSPTTGGTVQPGPVLAITSTRRLVTIALAAAQQAEVKVGDAVTIRLPNNQTTAGRVSYVGTVATVPASSSSGGGGGSSTPTVEVDVTPTDPAATGRLDQAPVNVSITTASVRNALVVPVNALLALASGGYAVEEVEASGAHHLVAVNLGLFDDSRGLVQVTGSGLQVGQRIVVPAA